VKCCRRWRSPRSRLAGTVSCRFSLYLDPGRLGRGILHGSVAVLSVPEREGNQQGVVLVPESRCLSLRRRRPGLKSIYPECLTMDDSIQHISFDETNPSTLRVGTSSGTCTVFLNRARSQRFFFPSISAARRTDCLNLSRFVGALAQAERERLQHQETSRRQARVKQARQRKFERDDEDSRSLQCTVFLNRARSQRFFFPSISAARRTDCLNLSRFERRVAGRPG
jgi:hypothetical protein